MPDRWHLSTVVDMSQPVPRPLVLPAVVPVAGVSFHQDVVSTLKVGDVLRVLPEPENPYDAAACVVMTDSEVVGHVPRTIAPRLRMTGSSWLAEVVEVLPGDMAVGLRVKLSGSPEPEEVSPAPIAALPQAKSLHPVLREVRARSGRRLGRYNGRSGDQVLVLTDDDRTVSFPASLVLWD